MLKKVVVTVAICVFAAPVLADWSLGDPCKMHYPQLPNPTGWAMNVTYVAGQNPLETKADDWQCTESGPVSDIHFWGSWLGDTHGTIDHISVGICSDVPAGSGLLPYSTPGIQLWTQTFHQEDFTSRACTGGPQGWYDTSLGQFWDEDHYGLYQYNITGITNPFIQTKDQIYWLAILVYLDAGSSPNCKFGWNTSNSLHFMDDAVYLTTSPFWSKLEDPWTGMSMDMAFVITPEPASLALLALGGLLAVRRRSA